jgi:hypothetical protein
MLKVNDENKRIRIHQSEAWIRGSASGSGSTPKCHGTATLTTGLKIKFLFTKNGDVLVTFGRYS